MAELSNATEAVTDTDLWMEAGMVLAGLAGSVVLKNGIDSRFDLPDELYGVVVAAGAAAMGYTKVSIGGMGYTGIKAAERVGFKSTVENAGSGN
ncbi:hypothetical protein [Halobellus captivus]|uniref:hypothetical protein n=1 Tax=Halobellus captivus TaxID=2592614 RepID=UPI0011A27476|nr:hypothetical protein [Halobellus captivus]